jgi:hypothetical protein
MDTEFVSQAEAVVLLDVTHAMVLYMVREQKILRRYHRGGKIAYRLADILALRDARVGHVKVGRPSGRMLLERRQLVESSMNPVKYRCRCPRGPDRRRRESRPARGQSHGRQGAA